MPRIERNKDGSNVDTNKSVKMLALGMAMVVLVLMASAKDVQVDLSRDARLNITESKYQLIDGKANCTVQVKNEGQILIKNVRVKDFLPSGVAYHESNTVDDLPLLIRIEHEAGLVKNLAWYVGDIDTGKDRWVNFTVQIINKSVNLSNHIVQAEGEAFGYLIRGPNITSEVLNSVPVVETETINAPSESLAGTIADTANMMNDSIDISNGGNKSFEQYY
jgi:uncharacterized repeat protein (TIGR01451 family)